MRKHYILILNHFCCNVFLLIVQINSTFTSLKINVSHKIVIFVIFSSERNENDGNINA